MASDFVDLAIEGGDLVITIHVPLRKLEGLLDQPSKGLKIALKGRHALPGGQHSKIHRNPEVKAALDAMAADIVTYADMRRRLIEKFGIDLTPSRTAIGRYVRARRVGLGWLDPRETSKRKY